MIWYSSPFWKTTGARPSILTDFAICTSTANATSPCPRIFTERWQRRERSATNICCKIESVTLRATFNCYLVNAISAVRIFRLTFQFTQIEQHSVPWFIQRHFKIITHVRLGARRDKFLAAAWDLWLIGNVP